MTTAAIEITGVAQKNAWAQRLLPPVEEISPGVWSVPVPCTDFSIRYTLAYVIVGDAGKFIVVDPGWNAPESRRALLAGIDEAGLGLDGLIGLVVTHHHPDHLALVDIAPESAWVGMHPLESAYLGERPGHADWAEGERDWLRGLGVPEDELPSVESGARELDDFHVDASPDLDLVDGDLLPLEGRRIRVLWTPGHTAGHICLAVEDAGLILSGDHLLPRISPNVGAHWFDGRRDSVGEYLASLDSLLRWEGFEVCPAHEYRFRGIRVRVKGLRDHQAERSAEVSAVQAAHPDATPWEIAPRLHWSRSWESLDPLNRRAALGETVAQLIHLGVSVHPAPR